jgi:hypothetical protein
MCFLTVFGTLREDLVDRFTAGLKVTIYTHVSASDYFGHSNFPLELNVGFITGMVPYMPVKIRNRTRMHFDGNRSRNRRLFVCLGE